jgi:uncharacterized membrane protein YecN with MAPEG domain
MSVPVWVLLAFAGWTLATLLATVGIYRWTRILTRRAEISAFRADEVHGDDWYKRAMRAHANCVENLPVYGAIVVAMVVARVTSPLLDTLALVLMGARVLQTTTHVAFVQTNRAVGFRFAFFLAQLVCMGWMGVYVALRA